MVTIQLHQSLVNNVIARLGLNGGSFTGQELAKHLQDVLGLDVDASSDENQKDAQFKFAGLDPIRIDFKDGRVNVVINLDSLQVGGAAKPIRRLSITAAYKIEADGMQVRLTQDDTGTRVTSRGKRLRLGDRAVVSTVMKMLFQPSYSLNALPKKFRERPQAQSLVISSLIVYNGWLAVEMDDVLVAQSAPSSTSVGWALLLVKVAVCLSKVVLPMVDFREELDVEPAVSVLNGWFSIKQIIKSVLRKVVKFGSAQKRTAEAVQSHSGFLRNYSAFWIICRIAASLAPSIRSISWFPFMRTSVGMARTSNACATSELLSTSTATICTCPVKSPAIC